jgi:4-amino-4-deoxychorismate lyase
MSGGDPAGRWWVNGRPARTVEVADRGLTYGDGLFETLAVRQGLPRLLEFHLDRLEEGARRLALWAPDRKRLAAELEQRAAELVHGTLKLILTRGPGPRGYRPPEPVRQRPTLILGAWPARRSGDGGSDVLPVLRGIQVRLCRTRASRNPATAGLKTLNRLEQVLARAEWNDPAIAEGLMLDEAGNLVGGTMGNLFLVHRGRLLTPAVDQAGVAGVMRRAVLETTPSLGLPVVVGQVDLATLAAAEEVFLTNALRGLQPVVEVEGRHLPVGPVTRQLAEHLHGAFGVGADDA